VVTRPRTDKATVYTNVGVHGGVEIMVEPYDDGGDGAAVHFGFDGPELCIDFADVDSLERLATAAADGVRQLRERLAESGMASR
jgi:hypothetical protein